jgi:hypothetical protein
MPLLPLPPGTAEIHDAGHALVFGQIRIIRAGFDQMAHSFGEHYRVTGLIYDESAGVWERKVPASFHVAAGTQTYMGTWEIEFGVPGLAGRVSARVVNELATRRRAARFGEGRLLQPC